MLTFAFFLPPRNHISVVFWCERGINEFKLSLDYHWMREQYTLST